MRYAFLAFLTTAGLIAVAQNPAEEVLTAEKSFAARSVLHGAKAAFLAFLDSTGAVFENGKILNGLEVWSKKDSVRGVLNWRPLYGFVAASGELGFTTGPWTFQPKTTADAVTARGQYTTVWKRNSAGNWKVVADMGNTQVPSLDGSVYASAKEERKFVPGTWNNLLNREQKFMRQTDSGTADARRLAYVQAISKRLYFLNRNGSLPATGLADATETIKSMPQKINYVIQGSGLSAAGDLGYVYGTTVINGKAGNYLRIWRREGKEWRLTAEVLPY